MNDWKCLKCEGGRKENKAKGIKEKQTSEEFQSGKCIARTQKTYISVSPFCFVNFYETLHWTWILLKNVGIKNSDLPWIKSDSSCYQVNISSLFRFYKMKETCTDFSLFKIEDNIISDRLLFLLSLSRCVCFKLRIESLMLLTKLNKKDETK